MTRGGFIRLSVVLDALLVNAGVIAAFFLRFGGALPEFNFSAYAALWPFMTVAYLGAGYVYGLYEPERTESTWPLVRAVFQAVTLGTVLTTALAFFAGPRFFSFSRLVILIAWALQIALLVGWRLAATKLTPIHWPEQRILIVGTGELARELAAELEARSSWGYRVVGLLSRSEEPVLTGLDDAPPVVGAVSDAATLVEEHGVHRIIVASPVAMRELVEELALADESDVRLEVIPELYEIFIGTVDSTISDIPLMEITRPIAPAWSTALKRLLDMVFSVALLTLLSPLFVVVAFLILVFSGRPVLYVQERVGRDMRPFRLIKFRTMVPQAEEESGPVLAAEDDERITPLGRALRRYRIDELPQLMNILKGEMSFVGPRPERPFFVERHVITIAGYRERFRVKPGVTGLAQVSGSYATTPERKLKYDLIYMYHQSLLMDLQILVETLRVVLTGRGAR